MLESLVAIIDEEYQKRNNNKIISEPKYSPIPLNIEKDNINNSISDKALNIKSAERKDRYPF